MKRTQIENDQFDSDQEETNPIPNHTKKLGNSQFATYLKSQPQIATYIHNIEQYLNTHQIHSFYYDSLLSFWCGRSLESLAKLVKKEYEMIMSGKSFLHKINKAILSRYRCLEKIKRDLGKVSYILGIFKKAYLEKGANSDQVYIQYTQKQGYSAVDVDSTVEGSIEIIKHLFMDMKQLRDMTVYIIETIHRWRIQIEEWMDKCNRHSRVDFYVIPSKQLSSELSDTSERVYDIIHSDTNFIFSSRLREHIWFQHKSDPLLIRNVINIEQKIDEEKEVLEKYFVEFLFPKDHNNEEDTAWLDRCIGCLQMLNFSYEVKLSNLYAEEERLIENYLNLERIDNEEAGYHLQEQRDQNKFQVEQKERYQGLVKLGLFSQKKLSRVRVHNAQIIKNSKVNRQEIQANNRQFYPKSANISPYTQKYHKQDRKDGDAKNRGQFFGKQLKKPSSQRIRELVKKHEIEMQYLGKHKKMVKPFNIVNYPQKQSIALAYLAERKERDQIEHDKNGLYQPKLQEFRKDRNLHKKLNKKSISDSQQNIRSSSLQISRGKMYQSMVKLEEEVILEDPKQQEAETPTHKKVDKGHNKKYNWSIEPNKKEKNNSVLFFSTVNHKPNKPLPKKQTSNHKFGEQSLARTTTHHKIKLNSVQAHKLQQANNQQINIEGQQTPLNLKQFFEVFRADTVQNQKKNQMKQGLSKHKIQGNMAYHKLIDRKRAESLKYLKIYQKPKLVFPKKTVKNPSKKDLSKSVSKASHDSFLSYNRLDNSMVKSSFIDNQQPSKKSIENMPTQFIMLTHKKITSDVLQLYIPHLISQLPLSTKSFTQYHSINYSSKLLEILLDPTMHTIIFELKGEKSGKIGEAIVVEQLSRNLRLRYQILFIGVKGFELLIHSVSRIAQELLSVTMCEQVIWKCEGDKKDYVSQHFFLAIDKQLKHEIRKFGILNILEKDLPSYKDKQSFQRVYLMEGSTKRSIKQNIIKKNMINNYRSLMIECKSLLLSSNFKLRSENLTKGIIQNYREQSIGDLYVAVLKKVMTKYHMKQLKIASMSINQSDEIVSLVKNGPFLRTIFHSLLANIKKQKIQDQRDQTQSSLISQTSSFSNMTDLLNYLEYREHSDIFNFSFLNESRFLLNHQLMLAEVNIKTSLEFVISSSGNMLILNNYRNHIIQKVYKPSQQQNQSLYAYLLPTLTESLKLFLMNANDYLANFSQSLDLFTYLQLLMNQSIKQQLYDVEQIAIPDISKMKRKINNVKVYQGFERLFPERQFYSASMYMIRNLWESFYPNSVISLFKQSAIVFDFPLIMGFYDTKAQSIVVAFLLKQSKHI